ncbi:MAG: DUF1461 domain-containing protein [Bacilli bacterium]|nr:DUF1461 domain-containing protein [Bacilli bacterium]
MKKTNNILVLICNFCLFFCSIFTAIILIASSKPYFKTSFKMLGYYEEGYIVFDIGGKWNQSAKFTEAQFDEICDHIVDYMFTGKETFALEMDNVYLNDEFVDNVSIFGEKAVVHMRDVKVAVITISIIALVLLVVFVLSLVYIIKHRNEFKHILLKYSIYFYLGILGLFIIIALSAFVKMFFDTGYISFTYYMDYLWEVLHYIFFIFNQEKIEGSAFNDTLTSLLSIEFFTMIVILVVIIAFINVIAWFIFCNKLSQIHLTKEDKNENC